MPSLKMTVVDCGPLTLPKARLVAFAEGMVTIPTTVAIFEHPRHGIILWDTGCNDAVADPDRRDEYWGPGIVEGFGAQGFTRDHAIDRRLEKLGIALRDVKYVLYSHMHLDHAGGMGYFPDAIHVMQKDELAYAMAPDPWIAPVYCQNDFKIIHKLALLPVEGDCDLFSDGTFRLFKTPGHAPGHQILMVSLPQRGRFILGADIAHQRDQFEALIPMPWDYSTNLMTASRRKVKQMERSGVPLYICHEPSEFAALPGNGTFWD